MKKQPLPDDLQRYVKSRMIKKTIFFSLLEAVVITVLVLWGDILLGSATGTVLFILCALLILVPFFVTKIPFCLLDKTYFGVIELQLRMETSLENERPFKPTLEGQYTAVTAVLTVKACGATH